MAQELVPHPTDQQIYDAGMTRAGYKAAYLAQQRAQRITDQRDKELAGLKAAGWTGDRNPSRFNSGESGVPISKNRLAESIRSEQEEKARQLYRTIMLHRQAKIPVNYEVAEFLTLLGYTRKTIEQGVEYLNSPQAKERFGEIGQI